MITTIQNIKDTLNLELAKKQAVDCWIGARRGIFHAKDIILIDDDQLCLHVDDMVQVAEEPFHFGSYNETVVRTYPGEVTFAQTLEEAIADAKELNRIYNDEATANIEAWTKNIDEHMKQVYDIIEQMPPTPRFRSNLLKAVPSFSRKGSGYNYYQLRSYLGLCDETGIIDEQVLYEMRRIFHWRAFRYENPDNEDIETYVNLNNAISVQVDMQISDRACVCVTTADGKEHHIFKDKDPDLFNALNTLYS